LTFGFKAGVVCKRKTTENLDPERDGCSKNRMEKIDKLNPPNGLREIVNPQLRVQTSHLVPQ
jgi:hypothetical protein